MSSDLRSKEKVLATYIVRFSKSQNRKQVRIHDLRTGETLKFETWVAAWVFLEEVLTKAS